MHEQFHLLSRLRRSPRILTTVCVHDGAETWSTVAIPHPRYGVGAAAVGSKAFWAGGGTDSDKTRVAQVDVYDTAEGTWSVSSHTLSVGRWEPAGASVGNKVIFAGGQRVPPGSAAALETVAAVDIIDTVANTHSTGSLSLGRKRMAVATVGDLVVFAGGRVVTEAAEEYETDRVDVYDASAGSWSTGSLSSARSMAAAVSIGHAVYVAGGYGGQGAGTLDVIDVFDAISRRWSVASPSLSVARAAAVGVGVGGAMLFAGGLTKVTNPMNPAHATADRTATVDIVMLNTSGTCAPCPAGTRCMWQGDMEGLWSLENLLSSRSR